MTARWQGLDQLEEFVDIRLSRWRDGFCSNRVFGIPLGVVGKPRWCFSWTAGNQLAIRRRNRCKLVSTYVRRDDLSGVRLLCAGVCCPAFIEDSTLMSVIQRFATPADFDQIVAVVDEWWGRSVSHAIPRLFLDHFHTTSFVLHERQKLVAFLIGFLSPADSRVAYIHFVGVAPGARKKGFAAKLYQEFFDLALADGRTEIHAITAPINTGSIEFHRRLGFTVSEPFENYKQPGKAHVLFKKRLTPQCLASA